MHAAGRLLKLLNKTQIKHLISSFATLVNFFARKKNNNSHVDISKKLFAHMSKS